jgi:thiol:disulfide interchange protein DsbD
MKHAPVFRTPLFFTLCALVFALILGPYGALALGPESAPVALGNPSVSAPYSLRWELFRVAQNPDAAPTEPLALLWILPDPGIHAYSNAPGPMGQPTVLTATFAAPAGLQPQPLVRYPAGVPKPEIFDPRVTVQVYEGATPLFVELGDKASLAQELALEGELRMLLCSDQSCWPVKAPTRAAWNAAELNAAPEARNQAWWPAYLAARASGVSASGAQPALTAAPPRQAEPNAGLNELRLAPSYFQPQLEVKDLTKAIVFGFLAGLILNFMPCVLPVVSLKLSALVTASGIADERRRTRVFRTHNIFFALGVLSYFLALGLFLGFAGFAWGQIFQKPEVVLGLTALVFPLGLSLFGLFDLPIVDLKAGSDLTDKPRTQALFTGFLATLLATPCSGPLLGGVLGWTLTQGPPVIIGVFFWIGLGMATPYLLLATAPKLVRFFPKPGAWTLHLEKLVGFFLMATCIYLLSILPTSYLLPGLTLLWTTAFAAWMWGHWTSLGRSLRHRLAVRGAAMLLVVAVAAYTLSPAVEPTRWSSFEERSFMAGLGKERILLDFTADWCPNCKVLEMTTLKAKNLAEWKKRYNLTLLQADMTRDNPAAQALLRKLGSQSIPVVAIFPSGEAAGNSPLVLRDLFTPGQLDQALEKLFGAP